MNYSDAPREGYKHHATSFNYCLHKPIQLLAEAASYRTFQSLISLQACKLKLGQNK